MINVIRLIALLIFTSYATIAAQETKTQSSTFVLVHGATGGGWDWKEVAQLLSNNNHVVYRPTLSGLGDRHHLNSADINLTTHINDIVNLIVFENLQNIILVGHSYGGMVITGVMDRIPERIQHVTFLDAMVPDDNMSMIDERPLPPTIKIINGLIQFPWLDASLPFPRDVVQPLNTYTEAVSYKNPKAMQLDVTYVAFIPDGVSVPGKTAVHFWPSWLRAEKRHWTMRTFEGDHSIYRTKPVEFTKMLEATVNDRNKN